MLTANEPVSMYFFNSLRPRQNGRHFVEDILEYIILNGCVRIFIYMTLRFVPNSPIDIIPILTQIKA